MNKPVIIAVVVIVLAAGGFFGYQSMQQSTPSSNTNTTSESGDTNESQRTITKSSIAALIAAGGDVTCTFERDTDTGTQWGTVYVADANMRGDFTATEASGSNTMHVIRDDEWQYAWGGPLAAQQGVKMAITAADANANTNQQGSFDTNEDIDFSCQPWNADTTLFTPPADVTFQTMGDMMLGTGANTADSSDTTNDSPSAETPTNPNCSMCNQVPAGDSRDQCLAALGC